MISFPLGFVAGTIVGLSIAAGFLVWWLWKNRDWLKSLADFGRWK